MGGRGDRFRTNDRMQIAQWRSQIEKVKIGDRGDIESFLSI
jgi:hypothetical protein